MGQPLTHAVIYNGGGTPTDLGTLGGGQSQSEATAINDSGQIVGDSTIGSPSNNPYIAFLDSSGGTLTSQDSLGMPTGGYASSYATAINNGNGQIVGYAAKPETGVVGDIDEAFMYSQGDWIDLGTLGGVGSVATSINDSGQVVGYSATTVVGIGGTSPTHAFLFSASSEIVDLNNLIPGNSGWTLETATAINDSGVIAGVGIGPDHNLDGYLLTPSSSTSPQTPTITWADPANIVYGTTPSANQLDAEASVPGTFTYSPPIGTVLHAGTGQTLSVTFTPTDTTAYTTAVATVAINVLQARPTITWAPPAAIVFGTTLGAIQLDAKANVPGTLTYLPPPGTVLSPGNNQTLTVSFTPTDTTDYTGATAAATINVLQSTGTPTQPHHTNTTAKAKPTSSNVGHPIILTATVKNRDHSGGEPIGEVSFLDGTTSMGSATLVNGKASLRISGLPAGRYPIRVYYEGAGDFTRSTSAVLIETVRAHRSRTRLTSSQTYPRPMTRSRPEQSGPQRRVSAGDTDRPLVPD